MYIRRCGGDLCGADMRRVLSTDSVSIAAITARNIRHCASC